MINPRAFLFNPIATVFLGANVCTLTALKPWIEVPPALLNGAQVPLVHRLASGHELVLHHGVGSSTSALMDEGTAPDRMLVSLFEYSREGDHTLKSVSITCGDAFNEHLPIGSSSLGMPVFTPGLPVAGVYASPNALPKGGMLLSHLAVGHNAANMAARATDLRETPGLKPRRSTTSASQSPELHMRPELKV